MFSSAVRSTFLLSFFFLFCFTPACSSDDSSEAPDASTPKAGQLGASCAEDADCEVGTCQADEALPDSLCSMGCGEESPCPEGGACHAVGERELCLPTCQGDEGCREGYVCDYGACLPPCTAEDDCRDADGCFMGRCKAGCEGESDCPDGELCHSGACRPRCAKDEDCFPGEICDTESGACEPKPGEPMGAACTADDQCATGYCLPTRQICSAPCAGTLKCPAGYVCGMEKVDSDGNGTYEAVEADCIPASGDGSVGVSCQADADCASGHCYYGFCMEGCEKDDNCASAHQCVEVNILLDAGLAKYRGCLPRQGTSTYTLGAFPTSEQIHGFDVPPNAASFMLNAEIPSDREVPYVYELFDPSGGKVSELTADYCSYYEQTNRYHFSGAVQYSTLFVPNYPAYKLKPGLHQYRIGSTDLQMDVTVTLQLKLGKAEQGTLNINWVFLNLAGHPCVVEPNLNASSAPAHPWFSKARSEMLNILSQAGLAVGQETYTDMNKPALDVITLSDTDVSSELQTLFSSSAGTTGPSLNIYMVRSIEAEGYGGYGMILGIAGGIPGPAERHGLVHSGVAISMDTSCHDYTGRNTGGTIAHELGHYFGLYHSQESEMVPGLMGDEVVCPCPCGANMTCYTHWGSSWCRGEDTFPDTDYSTKNLMYYAAESTADFDGNQLSPGQIRVILDNPVVGH